MSTQTFYSTAARLQLWTKVEDVIVNQVTGRQQMLETDLHLGTFKPMHAGKYALGILTVKDPKKAKLIEGLPSYGRSVHTDFNQLPLKEEQQRTLRGTRTASRGMINEVNRLKQELVEAKKPTADKTALDELIKLSAELLKSDGEPRKDADEVKLKRLEELKASL